MRSLENEVDGVAADTAFSGVVRANQGDSVMLCKAYGLAHRGCGIANAVDTQFAIASGTKALTASTVVSLVEEGRLELSMTARSMLGADVPLISDEVTVEQLLGHRSGMVERCDAGVSFRTVHDPSRRVTHTVLANTSRGAWPVTRRLGELLDT